MSLPSHIRVGGISSQGEVATFAQLSLERRAVAALNVIDNSPGLTIPERCELVCLAVWPTDALLPGPVIRGPGEPPDVDLRPAGPPRPATRHPATTATAEQRARAREAFRSGASIQAIADELGVTWMTARGWVRAKG